MGVVKRYVKRQHAASKKKEARVRGTANTMGTVVGGIAGAAKRMKEAAPYLRQVRARKAGQTARTQEYAKSKVRHR